MTDILAAYEPHFIGAGTAIPVSSPVTASHFGAMNILENGLEIHAPARDVAILVMSRQHRAEQWTDIFGTKQRFRFSANSWVFIPAGCASWWHGPVLRREVLHIHIESAAFSEEHLGVKAVSSGAPLLAISDPLLGEIGAALSREIESDQGGGRLYHDGLGIVLAHRTATLGGMLEHTKKNSDRDIAQGDLRVRADWRVRRVIERLDAAICEDIGLAELAMAVDLSPRHLSDLFRAATGLPPHRWLTRRRVELARDLLDDPKVSVTSIAHACGFASSQHFANVFKRQMGVTPTEYRRDRL